MLETDEIVVNRVLGVTALGQPAVKDLDVDAHESEERQDSWLVLCMVVSLEWGPHFAPPGETMRNSSLASR